MTEKPPPPTHTSGPWTRIDVDTDEGSDFHRLNQIARHAAAQWALGPAGANASYRTLSDVVDNAVHEALLHLLELGLIDIDSERMNAAPGWPMHRERNAP